MGEFHLCVPTTKRNYAIATITALFFSVVVLFATVFVANRGLDIALLSAFFEFVFAYRFIEYLLTKKTLGYWLFSVQFFEGKSAIPIAVISLIVSILILTVAISPP